MASSLAALFPAEASLPPAVQAGTPDDDGKEAEPDEKDLSAFQYGVPTRRDDGFQETTAVGEQSVVSLS